MTAIDDFLAHKQLAPNSEAAYRYDLEQFRQVTEGEIHESQLLAYQRFLRTLKPTAQKRKLSAVNQFLFFLYETGQLSRYHKLQTPTFVVKPSSPVQVLDLSKLWAETDNKAGQLIALLILELGLQPTEILKLKQTAINLDFSVLTVTRGREKRVLKLPEPLLPYFESFNRGTYLFDKQGEAYSRQWGFNQLNTFLSGQGYAQLTAQKLREQFILRKLADQVSLAEIAKLLGLKSGITLEKYIK